MFTTIVLLALMQGSPAAAGFTVHVRAVDPNFMVLLGVDVSVRAVDDCLSRRPTSKAAVKRTTDAQGAASFAIEDDDTDLLVQSHMHGFESVEECIPGRFASKQVEPRYVQLRLRLDPSMGVTIEEPSASAAERPKPPAEWPLGAFWGTYRDARGRYFVVPVSPNDETLYVGPPDQRVLAFPKRSGTAFSGPDGTVRFVVARGRVVAMEFTPALVRATRRQ